MTPILATCSDPARTGDPTLPSLVEWAVDELDAVPTAVGHCYDCGFPGCLREAGAVSAHDPHPWTLEQWANITAGRIEWKLPGLGVGISKWSEAQESMVRALAQHLLDDADVAARWRRDA